MNDTQRERILVMLPLCLEDTRMPSYLEIFRQLYPIMPNSASFPKSTAVPARSGSPHIMDCSHVTTSISM